MKKVDMGHVASLLKIDPKLFNFDIMGVIATDLNHGDYFKIVGAMYMDVHDIMAAESTQPFSNLSRRLQWYMTEFTYGVGEKFQNGATALKDTFIERLNKVKDYLKEVSGLDDEVINRYIGQMCLTMYHGMIYSFNEYIKEENKHLAKKLIGSSTQTPTYSLNKVTLDVLGKSKLIIGNEKEAINWARVIEEAKNTGQYAAYNTVMELFEPLVLKKVVPHSEIEKPVTDNEITIEFTAIDVTDNKGVKEVARRMLKRLEDNGYDTDRDK